MTRMGFDDEYDDEYEADDDNIRALICWLPPMTTTNVVCVLASGSGGVTVKHAIPIASAPPQ